VGIAKTTKNCGWEETLGMAMCHPGEHSLAREQTALRTSSHAKSPSV